MIFSNVTKNRIVHNSLTKFWSIYEKLKWNRKNIVWLSKIHKFKIVRLSKTELFLKKKNDSVHMGWLNLFVATALH